MARDMPQGIGVLLSYRGRNLKVANWSFSYLLDLLASDMRLLVVDKMLYTEVEKKMTINSMLFDSCCV